MSNVPCVHIFGLYVHITAIFTHLRTCNISLTINNSIWINVLTRGLVLKSLKYVVISKLKFTQEINYGVTFCRFFNLFFIFLQSEKQSLILSLCWLISVESISNWMPSHGSLLQNSRLNYERLFCLSHDEIYHIYTLEKSCILFSS